MDNQLKTVGAGEFRQKCSVFIDEVAATGVPIVISKYGKPAAQLMPLWSSEETEERILAAIRSGDRGMLVEDESFLSPTSEIAG